MKLLEYSTCFLREDIMACRTRKTITWTKKNNYMDKAKAINPNRLSAAIIVSVALISVAAALLVIIVTRFTREPCGARSSIPHRPCESSAVVSARRSESSKGAPCKLPGDTSPESKSLPLCTSVGKGKCSEGGVVLSWAPDEAVEYCASQGSKLLTYTSDTQLQCCAPNATITPITDPSASYQPIGYRIGEPTPSKPIYPAGFKPCFIGTPPVNNDPALPTYVPPCAEGPSGMCADPMTPTISGHHTPEQIESCWQDGSPASNYIEVNPDYVRCCNGVILR